MGHKPSNQYQMDRPESGGADNNSERENSGLLDRAKQEFAESQKAKSSVPAPEALHEPGREHADHKSKSGKHKDG